MEQKATFGPTIYEDSPVQNLNELLVKRSQLMRQAEAMSLRELSPEEQGVLDSLVSQIRELDTRVTTLENGSNADKADNTDGEETKQRSYYGPARAPKAEGDLLGAWLRSGTPVERAVDREALRGTNGGMLNLRADLGVVSNAPKGNNLVPRKFADRAFSEIALSCPILSFAHVFNTDSGAPFDLPIDNDVLTNEGHWRQQLEEDIIANPGLDKATFNAFTATSKAILASWELLADSGVNASDLFARQLGQRLGKILEQSYINGTGADQPTGVLHGAGTATGLQVHETTASGAIALDDILAGIAKVDPANLQGDKVRALLNPAMLYKLRSLKDGYGRFLLADPVEGMYPTLLGIKTELSSHVPDGQIVIANFDLYWIRMAKQIELIKLAERYAMQRASAFFGWVRTDAKWVSTRGGVVIKVKA